jgi:hypothetical protein
MTSTGQAEPGDIRFSEIGDVEIFDGESWTAIDPILNDPDAGMREEPDPASLADPPP